MKGKMTVRQTLDKTDAIRKAVQALTEQDVYIGIPEDKTSRNSGDGISNAMLGYIHEFGAPANNLPARSALLPGIKDIQEDAAALLKGAAASALDGNVAAVEQTFNKIGLLGQNSVRAKFVDNEWPALLNPSQKRQKRGALNPLLDTGQLRKAYTYTVRKRGASLVLK
jgi:hypothetical protein